MFDKVISFLKEKKKIKDYGKYFEITEIEEFMNWATELIEERHLATPFIKKPRIGSSGDCVIISHSRSTVYCATKNRVKDTIKIIRQFESFELRA